MDPANVEEDSEAFVAQLMEYIVNHDLAGISLILYDVSLTTQYPGETSDGLFPLLLAAILGDPRIVRLLLQAGCDPNQALTGSAFNLTRLPTPLHHAVSNGNIEVTRILLTAKDMNIDPLNADHETPLHMAVETANVDLVKLLVDSGADVNITDDQGNSLIHTILASHYWTPELLQLLLESPINLDMLNKKDMSMVKLAAFSGNQRAVQMLVKAGCKISSDPGFLSALEVAIVTEEPLEAISKLLEAEDVRKDESLHMAARYGSESVMELVISKRQSLINSFSCQGETPLLTAVRHQNTPTLQVLLANGADPSKPSSHGIAPLCKATLDNNFSYVQLLINHGASLDAGLATNNTALHKALFCGFQDIVITLIQAGAHLNMWALRLVQANHDWALLPLIHAAGWPLLANNVAAILHQKPHGISACTLAWAHDTMASPASLMTQCRKVIRHAVPQPVSSSVQSLGLPKLLKEYVLLQAEAHSALHASQNNSR